MVIIATSKTGRSMFLVSHWIYKSMKVATCDNIRAIADVCVGIHVIFHLVGTTGMVMPQFVFSVHVKNDSAGSDIYD